MIPLSIPTIQGNEWKYIKECLDTNWVSSAGKYVDTFENNIADYVKAKYAVAVVNGTAGLQLALRLVGLQYDEEVIVPTITFIAPVNAVRYFNAYPVFMDAEKYYNMDIEKSIEFIEDETVFKNGFSYNKKSKRLIRAIIPVHVFGNPVDLKELVTLCNERNIKIIEDSTESLGSYYFADYFENTSAKVRYTGTIGDIGVFSFNGNKIITTGGGGMFVTNNPEYAEKAKYLSTQAKDDGLRYIHDEVGYNFRMTNIQAAMGVAQLELIDEFIYKKTNNYMLYKSWINEIPGLTIAETPNYGESNYWYYCLQIKKESYGKVKEELMKYLNDNGIQTRPVWYPNHLQKPFKDFQNYKIEKANELWENTLNIPCSVDLKEEDVRKIISKL